MFKSFGRYLLPIHHWERTQECSKALVVIYRQYTTEKGRRSVKKFWSLFTASTPLRKDAGVFKSFGRYLPPVNHWERTQECSKALVIIYCQYTNEKGRRSVQKLWSLFTASTPLRKDAGVFKSFGRYLPPIHHWERTQECSKVLVVIYRQYTTEKGRRSVQKLWSLFTASKPLRKDAGVFKSFGHYLLPIHQWERTQECSKALVVIYRQYTTEKGRRSVQKLWSLFTVSKPLKKDAGVIKSFGRYLPPIHHWERTQECSKALVVIYRQYTTEKGRRSVQKLWSLFTASTPLRKDAGVFKSFGRYLPPVTTEKGRRSVQKLWSLFTASTPLRKDAGVFKSFGRYLPPVHHWERTQECSKALVVIYRQYTTEKGRRSVQKLWSLFLFSCHVGLKCHKYAFNLLYIYIYIYIYIYTCQCF